MEALDPAYFTRKLRDARFDSMIRRAIEKGEPLNQTDIERILARYSDRLLRFRGEVIARSEALAAFNTGRDLAMR